MNETEIRAGRVAAAVGLASEFHGQPSPPDAVLGVWVRELAEYDIDLIDRAFLHHLRTSPFRASLCHILDFCNHELGRAESEALDHTPEAKRLTLQLDAEAGLAWHERNGARIGR